MSTRTPIRRAGRPPARTARRRLTGLAGLPLLCAGLLGCGLSTADASDPTAMDGRVSFNDGWVKAADSGMSAAFGELDNGTDHDVRLVSVSTPRAGQVQLHETAAGEDGTMSMRQKAGGFLVKSGTHHHFEPGADHLMLMDLAQPIHAGDRVPLTLTFADGSRVDVVLVARDFSGGAEDYHSHGDPSTGPEDGGAGGMDSGGMDSGGMDSGGMDSGDGGGS